MKQRFKEIPKLDQDYIDHILRSSKDFIEATNHIRNQLKNSDVVEKMFAANKLSAIMDAANLIGDQTKLGARLGVALAQLEHLMPGHEALISYTQNGAHEIFDMQQCRRDSDDKTIEHPISALIRDVIKTEMEKANAK